MYVFTRPLSFGFRYAWLHARPPFSCQNWGISIFRPSSLPQISWVVTSGLANLIPAIISFVLFPRSLDCFLPVEVLANAGLEPARSSGVLREGLKLISYYLGFHEGNASTLIFFTI